jgi:hypothetical protein
MHWTPGILSIHQPSHSVSISCLRKLLRLLTYSSTPETFDIVSSTVDIASRKNLAQISRVLTQITTGEEFNESQQPCYVPINDYVRTAARQLGAWFMEGQF